MAVRGEHTIHGPPASGRNRGGSKNREARHGQKIQRSVSFFLARHIRRPRKIRWIRYTSALCGTNGGYVAPARRPRIIVQRQLFFKKKFLLSPRRSWCRFPLSEKPCILNDVKKTVILGTRKSQYWTVNIQE
jgi:hypothetical protein